MAEAEPIELLLVEDDPADTALVMQQLERADVCRYGLRVVHTIADAEDKVVNDPVDCVLLDLALPDSDGIRSVERLHAVAPLVPIIVLTGRDEGELALAAIEAGAQDFLVKGVVRGNSILRCARWAVARMRVAGVVAAKQHDRWTVARSGTEPPEPVLDRMSAPAAYLDADMAIIVANPAFEQLLGYTERDLVGAPFTDLLVVDDLIGVVLEIRSVLKEDRPARLVTVALQHRGGGETPCTLAVACVVDARGTRSLLVTVPEAQAG